MFAGKAYSAAIRKAASPSGSGTSRLPSKIRRAAVTQRFADVVAGLYEDEIGE